MPVTLHVANDVTYVFEATAQHNVPPTYVLVQEDDTGVELLDFLTNHLTGQVEFMDIDTAANTNLEVILSIGEAIRCVKSGLLRMPTTRDETAAPTASMFIADDAIRVLADIGYVVTKITANNDMNTEVNIYFRRG